MPAHAAIRHSIHPTVHDAISNTRVEIAQVQRNGYAVLSKLIAGPWHCQPARHSVDGGCRSQCLIECRRFPVIDIVVFLMPEAEQAHAQPQIQSQTRGYAPIVLKIWFYDVVATVIVELRTILLKVFDCASAIRPTASRT